MTPLFFVIDEAAFGIESERMDYVHSMFNAFNNRRRSRWTNLGGGMLCTSPGGEQAFVETIAGEGEDELSAGEVMVRRCMTWEATGELHPGCKIFLFDRDVNVTRIVEEGLIFQGFSEDGSFGRATRPNGEQVRWRAALPTSGSERSAPARR